MKRAVNALQNFGKSLYGPVLILPIVGLFIAFGNVLGNGNLAEYLPFLGHPLIQSVGQLIAKSAVSVLVNPGAGVCRWDPHWTGNPRQRLRGADWAGNFYRVYQCHERDVTASGELAPAEQMKAAGQSMVLGVGCWKWAFSPGSDRGALRLSVQQIFRCPV